MDLFSYENEFAEYTKVPSYLKYGVPLDRPPLVSIMIPTYRRPELLLQAISSALAQTGFDDFEVGVVDNDSDGENHGVAEEIVRSFKDKRLLYYRNERNLGMTGNWNRCIELAKGEWITLLHDDDWLSPFFLRRMFQLIPVSAELMACYSETGQAGYDPNHKFPYVFHCRKLSRIRMQRLVRGNITPAPGILYRRSKALAIGGFCNYFYPCSDYAFNVKFSALYDSYLLNERLAYYRVSDSQTYKGDTLNLIMSKCQEIIRNILDKYSACFMRFFAFSASMWWCWFGRAKGLDIDTVFKGRLFVYHLSRCSVVVHVVRATAFILLIIF